MPSPYPAGFDCLAVRLLERSANAAAFSWNFGDGTASAEANPDHHFPSPGAYVVGMTAIASNGVTDLCQRPVVTRAGVPGIWYSRAQQLVCPSDHPGATVNVPAGMFTSTISQADADGKASAYGYALLSCSGIYYSAPMVATATCAPWLTGHPTSAITPAGAFSSTVSQPAADSAAFLDTQARADAARVCVVCPVTVPTQLCEGASAVWSDGSLSTAALVAAATTALPSFTGTLTTDACAAGAARLVSSGTCHLRRLSYRLQLPVGELLVGVVGYQLTWVERFYPLVGSPSVVASRTYTWNGYDQSTPLRTIEPPAADGEIVVESVAWTCPA